MLKTDIAWAAGIIDGEGCILIRRTEPKRKQVNPTYTCMVTVNMCDVKTVKRLRQLLGVGVVYALSNHAPNSITGRRASPQSRWRCVCRDAEKVLKILRPYIFTKAREADIALSFLALPIASQGGGRRVSKKLLAKRESHYWRLRKAKTSWAMRGFVESKPRKKEDKGK